MSTMMKSTSNAKTSSSRTLKDGRQAAVLLPPDRALEKAGAQELLFGTSSQLARDDSPTFVRELQQAMKESESLVVDSPQVMGESVTASVGSGSTNGSSSSLFTASRSLWSAAARDLNGSLHEAEVIDLSKTPRPPSYSTAGRSLELPAPIQQIQTPSIANNTTLPADRWTNVDDIATPEHQQPEPHTDRIVHKPIHKIQMLSKASDGTAPADGWTNIDDIASPENQQQEAQPDRILHKSLAEAASKNRPKSRSPVKKSKVKDTRPKPPGMPNYEGFTSNQLGKQLKAYGLTDPKRRETQITLLENCWESKNRTALQSLEPNVNKPQQRADLSGELDATAKPANASPAKKKRGRPPKQAEVNITKSQNESGSKPSPGSKPRGRPRKGATEKTTPTKKPAKSPAKPKKSTSTSIIPAAKQPCLPPSEIPDSDAEIPDSDAEATPRAPPSHPVLPSIEPSTDFVTLSSPATNSAPPTPLSHTALLSKVTEAVKTYPPTHDMHNLTFYEKMLLYDPIVLEDLAAWLNTEGLTRVGVDDEVRYV